MYAVIANKAIHYLGTDKEEAVQVLGSKLGASMVNVSTLTELASLFSAHVVNECSQPSQTNPFGKPNHFSKAAERVLEILDEVGVDERSVEEVVQTLRERGQAAATEVRHVGIKGMRTVGEGFVALGDLLKKQAEESE